MAYSASTSDCGIVVLKIATLQGYWAVLVAYACAAISAHVCIELAIIQKDAAEVTVVNSTPGAGFTLILNEIGFVNLIDI